MCPGQGGKCANKLERRKEGRKEGRKEERKEGRNGPVETNPPELVLVCSWGL